MLTYLLPTHNRHEQLSRTLAHLGRLSAREHDCVGGAEVIVIDNASASPIECSATLANQWPVRVLRTAVNCSTAARNLGAQHAQGEWIIMLDDDSYPLHCRHVSVLSGAAQDVAAIGAEILLPDGSHEAGGLPEVFIGCGVALRRRAFLEVDGYDPGFDYYAEEYDLCAKLIARGWRIVHDFRFQVCHEKVTVGRDMNRILHRLVRNNGWVAQRYAPDHAVQAALGETLMRYGSIAVKEHAALGYSLGVTELMQTLNAQQRLPLSQTHFDRFTGIAHVRAALNQAPIDDLPVAIIARGKNAHLIEQALMERGVPIVNDPAYARTLIVGTLSPGPMIDAHAARTALRPRVRLPWQPADRSASYQPASRRSAALEKLVRLP